MSLKLPTFFENDIQSKDTSLVPIIAIGSVEDEFSNAIFLSTNVYSAETAGKTRMGKLAQCM